MKLFNKKIKKISLSDEKNSTELKPPFSNKFFKRTYLVIFLIAVLLTLAISGGVYWIMNVTTNQVEKPEKTTGRFVEFIKAGDINSAYDLVDVSLKSIIKEEQFADYVVKPNIDRFKNNNIAIEEKIEGKKDNKEYFSIVYRVDEKDDRKFYLSLKAQKVENKWKIQKIFWSNKKLAPVPI